MIMEFQQLYQRAQRIRQQYAAFEAARYGRSWTKEEVAMGFVSDVGDLMKLVLAHAGVRAIPEHQERLAHELADCLWSILVLADLYQIDLEAAFVQTMDALESHLRQESTSS
jgi:NTP pyrophosphatase (non-canonical NTP hydrolase)